jgi:hypothetical protein
VTLVSNEVCICIEMWHPLHLKQLMEAFISSGLLVTHLGSQQEAGNPAV